MYQQPGVPPHLTSRPQSRCGSRVTYSSFVADASMDGMDGIDLDESMAEGDNDDDDDTNLLDAAVTNRNQ